MAYDDYAGDTTTTGRLTTFAPVYGTIDWVDDQDWFRIYLSVGTTYQFNQYKTPINGILWLDSYVRLLDGSGNPIWGAANDDWVFLTDLNAQFSYSPTTSGYYYVSAQASTDFRRGQPVGSYELVVTEVNHAPVVTPKTVAIGVGQVIPLSALFSVSDIDGDKIAYYEFYDPLDSGFIRWGNTSVTWNPTDRTVIVAAADLPGVTYVGDISGAEKIGVAAADGAPLWSNWAYAIVTVGQANHPPVLNAAYSPGLSSILNNVINPSGNTVAQIVVNGSITDADTATPPEAIVIETVNNSLGTWQYSTNSGSTWQSITGLSTGHGLALSSTALIRLLPNGTASGTASFTFGAWDQSDGAVSGTFINYTAGKGAVSAVSDTASITVSAPTDTTPPAISTTLPANADTGVGVSSNIVITFDEAINPLAIGSIWLKNAYGTVIELYTPYNVSLSNSNKTLTIDPANPLSYNSGFKIEFAPGSIKDLAGNIMIGVPSFHFSTTQAAARQVPPATAGNIFTAAVNLSARAYSDTHYGLDIVKEEAVNAGVKGWAALTPADLGYAPFDPHFSQVVDSLLRFDNENASATVGLTMLEGKLTLGIAFEGTNFSSQPQDLWDDIVDISLHSGKLRSFMASVQKFVAENASIQQVLVTGHSLGGSMAQEFMSQFGTTDPRFVGVTFGSPGTVNPRDIPLNRMINFAHTDDVVPWAGQHLLTWIKSDLPNALADLKVLKASIGLLAGDGTDAAKLAVNFIIDSIDNKEQGVKIDPVAQEVGLAAASKYFGVSKIAIETGIANALQRSGDYKVVGSVVNIDDDYSATDPPLYITEHSLFFSSTFKSDVSYKNSVTWLASQPLINLLQRDVSSPVPVRYFTIGTTGDDYVTGLDVLGLLSKTYGPNIDDTIIGDTGNDAIHGGNGKNVVIYPGDQSGYSVLPPSFLSSYYTIVDNNLANGDYGTDKLYDIQEIWFGDGSVNRLKNLIFGKAEDGYISGATLYVDANGNGVPDPDENTGSLTDAQGNFNVTTSLVGALIAVGGTNTDTGLPNKLTLIAPEGSAVISPLTTLIQSYATQTGASTSVAEAAVQSALGITANIDLTQYDPLAQSASDATALAVQRVAAQVAELGTRAIATGTIFSAISTAIATGIQAGQSIDLANRSNLQSLLGSVTSATVLDAATLTNSAIAAATNIQTISTIQANAYTINGTSGPDIIKGTSGPDLINANAGDDRIIIGGGTGDTVNGGTGIDTVVFTNDKGDYLVSKNPTTGSYEVISKTGAIDYVNADVEKVEFRDVTVDAVVYKYYGTTDPVLAGSVSSVYRFFNTNDNAFFYTNSVAERDAVLANSDVSHNNIGEWPYVYQGSSFEAAHTYAGAVPLERFYNTVTHHHFFTSSTTETATVKANSASGAWPFVYEGVSFNVYASDPTPNSVGQEIPVERFYSATLNRHWFTADPTEITQIRLTGLWVDEGIGFWSEKPGA